MRKMITTNDQIFFDQSGWFCRAEDIDGNPVRRTKREYPYSYDCFITFRREEGSHKKASAVYSNRMWEWDNKKFDTAMKESGGRGQRFDQMDASVIQKFLRLYYGDDGLVLEAVGEGANQATGYPYWVFWFTKSK